jgi:hypothetical protein
MRVEVSARDWTPALRARFGEDSETHEMTCDEIVAAIIVFGRATIAPRIASTWLHFQNEID